MSGNNLKTHYSAKELLELSLNNLPNSVQAIIYQAKTKSWKGRKRLARGGGLEYEFSSFPQEIQAEILLKTQSANKVENKTITTQAQMSESAWNVFSSATLDQERRAERRFNAVLKLARLIENGEPLMIAMDKVVNFYAEMDDQTAEKISKGSLKRWWYKVKNFPQRDWLPMLLDRTGLESENRFADVPELAWQFFLKDYLRKSKPKLSVCYYRLTLAAEENGWDIPSRMTFKRKLEREFTAAEIALARGGEHELRELTAPQIRTVEHLEAYEIVNGDGYQHNVFVDWYENGSRPIRPKTWFWQDVRTRRILAYCVDDSENGDQIRQATLRMIKQYGIPKKILMDNTRAASDKHTTQQRKRGKQTRNGVTVEGMFDRLGIKVIRTLVFKGRGNGRAKPIERAFRRDSLPAYIDGDGRLEKFFTGWSVTEKTEDYQFKKGASKALFLEILEQGVRLWNDKADRETELGQGIYSANQLWERDYAQTSQVFATDEQLRQLMMLGESTKVDKHGRFTLKVGYVLNNQKNIYEAPALIGGNVGNVIVRYDPDNLHGTVYVYDQNGVYLCDAECVEKTAFDSEEGARIQRRLETQNRRIAKNMVENHEKLTEHEMAQYRKQFDVPDEEFVEPKEKLAFNWLTQTEGNAARKVETVLAEDELNEFEQGLHKGIAMMKEEKGL
ncbi:MULTISPECIES: transposase domain-containing protein [unclassified Pasteurella]|uniref:transposase domain-containing protein n=1 Tax=unclassified Pasteurella TaxID=2621516 RepID=UPI001073F53C|nr:Mu transposase C-terminal domain-containing protein [Pasteurella sp. 19428wF3_WM03]TFU50443.1 transposase [Pasteurella sp. WM03]